MGVVAILENLNIEKVEKEYVKSGFCHAFLLKDKSEIREVAKRFKEDGYYLETIVGYDKGEGVRLVYIFNLTDKVHRTGIYVDVAYFEEVDTISDIFSAGIWCESEIYDLLGNTFKGHPCLKRLLTPEGLQGYPLLKSWKEED
ncbi:MAG: NADH-quinone oxidoreductase subunit C [Proteobacteria bacterium]|nr:NADH-quinone oxidoreductase subunit C [Pseudomonadota bacterium]